MSQRRCWTSNFRNPFLPLLLIQPGLFLLGKLRLGLSGLTLKVISLPMSPFLSIKLFLSIRLKTLASIVNRSLSFLLHSNPTPYPVSLFYSISLYLFCFNYICVLLQYYSLDITYFKSSLDSHLLDLLWNKYWVNTLSSSPLLGNGDYVAGQISDLGTLQWHSLNCNTTFSVLNMTLDQNGPLFLLWNLPSLLCFMITNISIGKLFLQLKS